MVLGFSLLLISTVSGEPLTVSAAISLREPFLAIGRAFEGTVPGTRVLFNFASSGELERQIEGGAPVDVFAAAGEGPVLALERRGLLVPGTRRDFASNRLVLVRPRSGKGVPRDFADLVNPAVETVAIGDPAHVPVGDYAREALQRLGIWSTLQLKLVLGIHSRQPLDYVVRGEVEAGIVFESDARQEQGKVELVAVAPLGSHRPILYAVALVAETPRRELAQIFVSFLLGPKAQAILRGHGLLPPP